MKPGYRRLRRKKRKRRKDGGGSRIKKSVRNVGEGDYGVGGKGKRERRVRR